MIYSTEERQKKGKEWKEERKEHAVRDKERCEGRKEKEKRVRRRIKRKKESSVCVILYLCSDKQMTLWCSWPHTLTRMNMSSSFFRRFSNFSISSWHVWQTYRWLTAGPPPYLVTMATVTNSSETHTHTHRGAGWYRGDGGTCCTDGPRRFGAT